MYHTCEYEELGRIIEMEGLDANQPYCSEHFSIKTDTGMKHYGYGKILSIKGDDADKFIGKEVKSFSEDWYEDEYRENLIFYVFKITTKCGLVLEFTQVS